MIERKNALVQSAHSSVIKVMTRQRRLERAHGRAMYLSNRATLAGDIRSYFKNQGRIHNIEQAQRFEESR